MTVAEERKEWEEGEEPRGEEREGALPDS